MSAPKKPKNIIGLLIYLLRLVISKKLGPIWLRVVAAVLLGLLLALQLMCNGVF
jgi:hypothetical protein